MSRGVEAVRPSSIVPPFNDDAERAALAACLHSPEALAEVVDVDVSADDFYSPRNRDVYRSICEISERGEPVDVITVASQLEPEVKSYIAGLLDDYPLAIGARRHAELVAETAMLRRIMGAGRRIQELAVSRPRDAGEAADRAEQLLFSARRRSDLNEAVAIKDILGEVESAISALAEGGSTGLSTGIPEIDDYTGGLGGGNLVVVAARPSIGKSSLLTDFTLAAASQGVPVYVANLEMSVDEGVLRCLSNVARVPIQKLKKRLHEHDEDWSRVIRGLTRLAELPIIMDDSPSLSLLQLRAKVRRAMSTQPIGLVIVDYLQLMAVPAAENRQVAVAELSRGLKLLARELNVPVVCASQLNRSLEYREDKRPKLADIRESGAVENDADVVLGLYRDVVYNPDTMNPRGAEVLVLKQRNGPTGTINLGFVPAFAHFFSLQRPPSVSSEQTTFDGDGRAQ